MTVYILLNTLIIIRNSTMNHVKSTEMTLLKVKKQLIEWQIPANPGLFVTTLLHLEMIPCFIPSYYMINM